MFQTLAHADDAVGGITEPAVKFNDGVVGGPDLEIDFGTTGVAKEALGFGDDGPGQTVPLMFGINGKIVKPAAMAFVTGHDAGDDAAIKQADQKPVGAHGKFALDVLVRVVPGANEVASPPEGNDGVLIVGLKRSNLHASERRYLRASAWSRRVWLRFACMIAPPHPDIFNPAYEKLSWTAFVQPEVGQWRHGKDGKW